MKKRKAKTLLGRVDIVDFPQLDLFGIGIKVDTGAYTSSIHCHNIEVKNGILKCQFMDPEHENFNEKVSTFPEFSEKRVKSSNGMIEERFLIKTKISIFKKIYTIELSLTERGSMRYPVLLGRKFLTRKFIVDTSRKNLSFENIKITVD
ncbi:MAG: RimK/LysX family protein [Bacteroidales bacterium]